MGGKEWGGGREADIREGGSEEEKEWRIMQGGQWTGRGNMTRRFQREEMTCTIRSSRIPGRDDLLCTELDVDIGKQ